jgi:phage FluMu protein Com
MTQKTCNYCNGTSNIETIGFMKTKCPRCNGLGYTIEVTIPEIEKDIKKRGRKPKDQSLEEQET